jgi:amino acid transporter
MDGKAGGQVKMGLNATWSMAVGGMIGGGIFSVLGVVVSIAGAWAWLSFLLGGAIALLTSLSYVKLAELHGERAGAFTFFRKPHLRRIAGGVSWVLILGYILTISVYAFTFGNYLGEVAHLNPLMIRVAAGLILSALVVVNLMGVGEASWLEIFAVWGKLVVLVGVAVLGLIHFAPQQLTYTAASPGGWLGALLGAASVFMAYEGFELLTYDYDDIRNPKKILPRAVVVSIITVIAVYITVAISAASLVGAGALVKSSEVALAAAGQAALGIAGLILISIAAMFSTMSAINATLFATARLADAVANDGELPAKLCHRNRSGVPDYAIIILGAAALVVSVLGRLDQLIAAASLAFLLIYMVVNIIAAREYKKRRVLSWIGAAGSGAAALTLAVKLVLDSPYMAVALIVLVLLATLGRHILIVRSERKQRCTDADRA